MSIFDYSERKRLSALVFDLTSVQHVGIGEVKCLKKRIEIIVFRNRAPLKIPGLLRLCRH